MATTIDVVVFKSCNICLTGNPALFTQQEKQNFGGLLNCHYCTDHAQNLPGPSPNIWLGFKFHSNRFTLGWVIAESMKAVLLAHRVLHDSPRIHLRQIIMLTTKTQHQHSQTTRQNIDIGPTWESTSDQHRSDIAVVNCCRNCKKVRDRN